MLGLLLTLQGFHVAFLALHDWIPLGPLNDVRAVRQENPGSKLLIATFLSTVLFVQPLVAFLPERRGIRINTLHFVLHVLTLTTFVLVTVAWL